MNFKAGDIVIVIKGHGPLLPQNKVFRIVKIDGAFVYVYTGREEWTQGGWDSTRFELANNLTKLEKIIYGV